MVHVDGNGRHLEHGSSNGEELFCIVWKRVRKGEWGTTWGGTQVGVRWVDGVVRGQDGGVSDGQDKQLHSHQNGDEWGR